MSYKKKTSGEQKPFLIAYLINEMFSLDEFHSNLTFTYHITIYPISNFKFQTLNKFEGL